MADFDIEDLQHFIVRAKAATYAGDGRPLLPYRLGSHDLQFREEPWSYHDSYLGENDFIGQEAVYRHDAAVWAMNYYGRIVRPEAITSAEAGEVIRESLTELYREGRFLGGFQHAVGGWEYIDESSGDVRFFEGRERIERGGETVYELVYHGGTIRP